MKPDWATDELVQRLGFLPRPRLSELGDVVSQHRADAGRRMRSLGWIGLGTLGLCAVLFSGVAVVSALSSPSLAGALGLSQGALAGLGAALAVGGAAGSFFSFKAAWPHTLASFAFEVRRHGLVVYGSRRNVRAYPWPFVTELRYDVSIRDGVAEETLGVRFKDRSGYTFGRGVGDFEGLKRAVTSAWLNSTLPSALGTLRSGGELPFGPVTISQAGLSVSQSLHRWKDVAAVVPFNGALLVKRNDGTAITAAPLKSLENPVLLLAVAEDLLPHSTALTQ